MRRLLAFVSSTVIVALLVGVMTREPLVVVAAAIPCTWGQIKCCYADDPCVNECCPRPKEEGVSKFAEWVSIVLKNVLFYHFRVVIVR